MPTDESRLPDDDQRQQPRGEEKAGHPDDSDDDGDESDGDDDGQSSGDRDDEDAENENDGSASDDDPDPPLPKIGDGEEKRWEELVAELERKVGEAAELLHWQEDGDGSERERCSVSEMLNAGVPLRSAARSFSSAFHRAVALAKSSQVFDEADKADNFLLQGLRSAVLIEDIQLSMDRLGYPQMRANLDQERRELRLLLSALQPLTLSPHAARLWHQLQLHDEQRHQTMRDFPLPPHLLPEQLPQPDQVLHAVNSEQTIEQLVAKPWLPQSAPPEPEPSLGRKPVADDNQVMSPFSKTETLEQPIGPEMSSFDFGDWAPPMEAVAGHGAGRRPFVLADLDLNAYISKLVNGEKRPPHLTKSDVRGERVTLPGPTGSTLPPDVRIRGEGEQNVGKVNIGDNLKELTREELQRLYAGSSGDRGPQQDTHSGPIPMALPQQEAPSGPNTAWTYRRLAQCEALSCMVADVLDTIRSGFEALYLQGDDNPQAVELLIMVDNSGSMLLQRHEVMEALTLCMESLRKLELRFAVARFSTTAKTRVLKEFDQPMTYARGEQILASFSFEGGTHLSACFGKLTARMWPKAASSGVRRHVLLLTDGFVHERDRHTASYREVTRQHQCSLTFLFMQADQRILQTLTTDNAAHITVEHVSRDALSLQMRETLKRLLVDEPAAAAAARPPTAAPPAAAGESKDECSHAVRALVKELSVKEMRGTPPLEAAKLVGSLTFAELERSGNVPVTEWSRRFRVSGLKAALPFDDLIEQRLAATGGQPARPPQFEDRDRDFILSSVRAAYGELQTSAPTELLAAEADVAAAMEKLQGPLMELLQALQDHVFPHNKFTRRRGATKGSSLYLPGLIRAVISGWQYRKFLSAINAGGKRQYNVALCIDTSFSMHGHLERCLLEATLLLTTALHQLGLEHFTLIAFGERVQVLKTEEQPWDAAAMFVLLSHLRCLENATLDASSVELATTLLQTSSVRGPKRLFVLSDGYGSQGLRLGAALKAAAAADVEVTGISVGFDSSFVPLCYQRWVTAALPAALPEALTQLHQADDEATPPSLSAAESALQQKIHVREHNAAASAADVWKENSNFAFRYLAEQLKDEQEREFSFQRGSLPSEMQVDLAFAVDCSGSMQRFLATVKAQIIAITGTLLTRLQLQLPGVTFKPRFALVPFRDIDPPPANTDFTESNDLFLKRLKQLKGQGGGLEAEDVVDALTRGSQLSWQGKSRWLILFTDAPGHGPFMNPPGPAQVTDDKPDYDANGVLCQRAVKALQAEDVDAELFLCHCRPSRTQQMEAALRLCYETEGRQLHSADLFDALASAAVDGFHVVFCLDESPSMGLPVSSGSTETRWQALVNAYGAFITARRNDQAVDDHVSIIQFGTTARYVTPMGHPVRLQDAPLGLTMEGNGTAYMPALQLAAAELGRTLAGLRQLLVFMSDGETGDADAALAIDYVETKLKAQFPQLRFSTVGLGAAGHFSCLKSMAAKFPANSFLLAQNGLQLLDAFVGLANQCTTADTLMQRVGQRIADKVCDTIMLDMI